MTSSRRYLTRRDRDDGMVQITMMVRADEAARMFAVLDRLATERRRDISAETPPHNTGDRCRIAHRYDRVDAVMEIVEAYSRGDRPARPATELVITVSAQALAEDPATPAHDRAAVTRDGTVLSIATARRLACDASIVTVVEDAAGNPLAVGRKYRTVTTALRRALAVRDPACQFPGCTHRAVLEGHHIEHWIDGGATDLANLVNLCSSHHDLLHAHGFRIEPGPTFFDRARRPIELVPRPPVDDGARLARDPPRQRLTPADHRDQRLWVGWSSDPLWRSRRGSLPVRRDPSQRVNSSYSVGYVDRVAQFAFVDGGGVGVFDGANGIVGFFLDDNVTFPSAGGAGEARRIRIYDRALTVDQLVP